MPYERDWGTNLVGLCERPEICVGDIKLYDKYVNDRGNPVNRSKL